MYLYILFVSYLGVDLKGKTIDIDGEQIDLQLWYVRTCMHGYCISNSYVRIYYS